MAGPLLCSKSHADVAQLVEHHLAKVRVAGSNPVVRSKSTCSEALRRQGLFSLPPERRAAHRRALGRFIRDEQAPAAA